MKDAKYYREYRKRRREQGRVLKRDREKRTAYMREWREMMRSMRYQVQPEYSHTAPPSHYQQNLQSRIF